MVVASRENLESFCRARGVSIDWRVEIRSADGNLLAEQRFSVR